ncbi:MAG: aspartate/glutamate racemase family protein [Chloroflexi bacterium]|nr:aspartate/glutamate racemase family protein [Chloroflexota bacterium]
MTHEKPIGIVAGVGPFAGLDLLSKILTETAVAKDQDHLPIYSLSQPHEILDRTEYLLGLVAENPGYALARQLQKLAAMGAEVAGIPCNTAYAPVIFNVIKAELEKTNCPIQLLHMIEEVGRFLHDTHPQMETIGVLSTTGAYRAQIYPQVLEPLGFTVVVPDETMQVNGIHPAIYDPIYGIKANGGATKTGCFPSPTWRPSPQSAGRSSRHPGLHRNLPRPASRRDRRPGRHRPHPHF